MSSTTRWTCGVPAPAAPYTEKVRLLQSTAYDALHTRGDYPAVLGEEPAGRDRDIVLSHLLGFADRLNIPAEMAHEHISLVLDEEADGGWEPNANPDGSVTVTYDDVSSGFGWNGFDLAVQHSLALAGSDEEVSYYWKDEGDDLEGAGEVVITAKGKTST